MLLHLELVVPLDLERAHNLVVLDVLDLGHQADLVDGAGAELARVALDVPVVDVREASERVALGVGGVHGLEEVHVVRQEGGGDAILEHDDVRVVDGAVGVLVRDQRREGHACDPAVGAGVSRERRGRRQRDGQERDTEQAGHRRRRRREGVDGMGGGVRSAAAGA